MHLSFNFIFSLVTKFQDTDFKESFISNKSNSFTALFTALQTLCSSFFIISNYRKCYIKSTGNLSNSLILKDCCLHLRIAPFKYWLFFSVSRLCLM